MRAIVLALLLSGCAAPSSPSCFVGFGLFPLGPFVICGSDIDTAPTDPDEEPLSV